MTITVGVDSVTFLISRVLTSAVFVGIGGVVALMAGEKVKIPKTRLKYLAVLVGVGAGLATFTAGWASIKISLCVGLGMTLAGVSLGFDKGAARLAAAIGLLAAGTAWIAWILYLMFR